MTEKELKQLYYLNRETELLIKELNDMKYRYGYKSPTISDMPRSMKGRDISDYIAELVDLENMINLNLHRIQRERARLERYIGGIEDAEVRLIFRLRHINGMSWIDIATELGYKGRYRESTVRKKYKSYLQKVSENSD